MKNNEVPDVLFFGAYIVTLKGCFLHNHKMRLVAVIEISMVVENFIEIKIFPL